MPNAVCAKCAPILAAENPPRQSHVGKRVRSVFEPASSTLLLIAMVACYGGILGSTIAERGTTTMKRILIVQSVVLSVLCWTQLGHGQNVGINRTDTAPVNRYVGALQIGEFDAQAIIDGTTEKFNTGFTPTLADVVVMVEGEPFTHEDPFPLDFTFTPKQATLEWAGVRPAKTTLQGPNGPMDFSVDGADYQGCGCHSLVTHLEPKTPCLLAIRETYSGNSLASFH